MFTAALFTTAKTWKQPKCLSTDKWIKKRRCIDRMEYYSAMKNLINAICSKMDGPRVIILSEVNQRRTNIICYHLRVESNKKDTK